MLLSGTTFLMLALTLQEQSSYGQSTCEPFRLLIIWHTTCGEDESFFQQRRFIIDLIRNVTDDTEILLTTVDTSLKYLVHIKKDSTNDTWMRTIGSHKPANLNNHIILYSLIRTAMYRYLNQVGIQKIAEEIFLIVNTKSDINDTGKVKQIIKNKITFIIYTGTNPPQEVWTSLATDKYHRFVLSDRLEESVKPVSEEILIRCCQDSRLICDTDEYWTGKRCYKCSHICSIDTKNASGICLDKCPYFASDQYATVTEGHDGASNQTAQQQAYLSIGSLLILILAFGCIYGLWKKKRSCDGTVLTQDRSATEELELSNTASNHEEMPLDSGVDMTRDDSHTEDETKPILNSKTPYLQNLSTDTSVKA